jgi:hypothetical protein
LDRSRLVFPVVGATTALASSLSTTLRMTIAPLVRSVTVFAWWVRPRAAMRFHAPVSRSL